MAPNGELNQLDLCYQLNATNLWDRWVRAALDPAAPTDNSTFRVPLPEGLATETGTPGLPADLLASVYMVGAAMPDGPCTQVTAAYMAQGVQTPSPPEMADAVQRALFGCALYEPADGEAWRCLYALSMLGASMSKTHIETTPAQVALVNKTVDWLLTQGGVSGE